MHTVKFTETLRMQLLTVTSINLLLVFMQVLSSWYMQ